MPNSIVGIKDHGVCELAAFGKKFPDWRDDQIRSGQSPIREEASLGTQRREAEKEAIRTALLKAGDNRTVAARILGVSRRTLYNKLEEYGIS